MVSHWQVAVIEPAAAPVPPISCMWNLLSRHFHLVIGTVKGRLTTYPIVSLKVVLVSVVFVDVMMFVAARNGFGQNLAGILTMLGFCLTYLLATQVGHVGVENILFSMHVSW